MAPLMAPGNMTPIARIIVTLGEVITVNLAMFITKELVMTEAVRVVVVILPALIRMSN